MKLRWSLFVGVLGTCLIAGSAANAALITAPPVGAIDYPFGNANYRGLGPIAVAPGITWLSNDPFSLFAFTGIYGYGANGNWTGSLGGMAGLNESAGTMAFSFSNPVQAVGGFMNWVPSAGTAVISAYDSHGTQLGTDTLTFLTSGNNQGEFLGFEDASADISAFTLSGAYIGITEFAVLGTPARVPEPSSLPMLLTGLGLIGGAVYFGRKKARHA